MQALAPARARSRPAGRRTGPERSRPVGAGPCRRASASPARSRPRRPRPTRRRARRATASRGRHRGGSALGRVACGAAEPASDRPQTGGGHLVAGWMACVRTVLEHVSLASRSARSRACCGRLGDAQQHPDLRGEHELVLSGELRASLGHARSRYRREAIHAIPEPGPRGFHPPDDRRSTPSGRHDADFVRKGRRNSSF